MVNGLGTVTANNSVLIRSRVDGQIDTVDFREGQIVHEGDLLVRIDGRSYRAALEQAQAKRMQDQANLDNAKRDLERSTSLARNAFATRQQLDTQTAQVAQLTAQIAADEAAIDDAETQVAYTTIRSPITGRAGFRLVDRGNIVSAAATTGIVQISQLQPITVTFSQAEASVPQLQSGQKVGPLPVAVYSTGGTVRLAEGEVSVINNTIDASSGRIRLKAVFPNDDGKLWPGMSVTTRLTVDTREDVVVVASEAVLTNDAGSYVYVVDPDMTANLRPVEPGPSFGGRTVIEHGLEAGDRVVSGGHDRLAPGFKVSVRDW